jgi:hypothetical protein
MQAKIISAILAFIISYSLVAQPYPPDSLYGKELRVWLRVNWFSGYYDNGNTRYQNKYYSNAYQDARREMYNYIDNINDSVRCVYGSHKVYVSYAGVNSNPQPINAEHTVPQSFFGSKEPMMSDLHHLFPVYANWNSTRQNFPFDEINDNETTKWMYLISHQASKPTSNIDLYSEFSSVNFSRFEPPEAHKGDAARAIFYFFTIYEDNHQLLQSISALGNLQVLYNWHTIDSVDLYENNRNDLVADYQGNRNPYIEHPELVGKAFGFVNPPVDTSTIGITENNSNWNIVLFPNPAGDFIKIKNLTHQNIESVYIINTLGQSSQLIKSNNCYDVSRLTQGFYLLLLYIGDEVIVRKIQKS